MKLQEYQTYPILPGKEQETIDRLVSDYVPHRLFIREVGSSGGKTLVNEELTGRPFSLVEKDNKKVFYVDGKEVFTLELDELGKRGFGLSLQLNYFGKVSDHKYEPCLRTANFDYYVEVYFAKDDLEIERASQEGNYWILK